MGTEPQGYRQPGGVAPPEPGPSDRDIALALAAKLVRAAEENGAEADDARAELAGVSRAVSDLVADDLVGRLRADPMAVCAVFSNHVVPLWFPSSRDKLIRGLEDASAEAPMCRTFVVILRTMPIRHESVEGAGLLRRALSVLGRPWVIAFVLLPVGALGLGVVLVEDTALRLALAGVIAALVLLAYVAEAFGRRCPSCRRLLAGMATGMRHTGSHSESVSVETTSGPQRLDRVVHGYATLWRCVHCKHRWQR